MGKVILHEWLPQRLLNSLGEAVLIADENARIYCANQQLCELLACSEDELLHTSLFDLTAHASIAQWNTHTQPAETSYLNLELINKQGEKVPVKARASTVDLSGNRYVFWSFHKSDQRKDINEILRLITEGTASVIGGDFFRSLALHLTNCLEVQYAIITECANAAKTRVRTLVFIERNDILENFEYDLEGTPCMIVMEGQPYYCQSDLEMYFTKEVGIQSYYGVPIFFSSGEVAGHVAIFDTAPMDITQRETDILTIFATRAGAEIERKHKNEILLEDKARFEKLFDDSPVALWEGDFSAIYRYLQRKNINDLPAFFEKNPRETSACFSGIEILETNKASLDLFQVESKEALFFGLSKIFTPEVLSTFGKALAAFFYGEFSFEAEIITQTLHGVRLHLTTQWSIVPGHHKDWSKIIVSFVDITPLKDTETQLKSALHALEQMKNRLQAENIYLQEEIKLQYNFDEIVTQSEVFKKVLTKVEQVAVTDATVLILGESGTGKELISRAIHNISKRNQRPLVKVNCAALPANLIESELFGHEKGAFTGAIAQRIGRFELADGGTIFLDEIGDLPLELQAKLLRVLQEGEFERLGNPKTRKVNVRVIAATNRDLPKAIAAGEFREDLYYRINVFPIVCPPLRERKEDIPLLVQHFCKKYEAKIGKSIERIPKKVIDLLTNYSWPGNIRELENIIERSIILSPGNTLELDDWMTGDAVKKSNNSTTLEEVERQHILDMLEQTGWKVSGERGAAKMLGLKPTTLEARMKKLGIERKKLPVPA